MEQKDTHQFVQFSVNPFYGRMIAIIGSGIVLKISRLLTMAGRSFIRPGKYSNKQNVGLVILGE